MQAWRDQSLFAEYLIEHVSDPVRNFSDAAHFQPSHDQRHERLATLQNVYASLVQLQPFFALSEQENKWIDQLKGYVERLRTTAPAQSLDEQFGQLYALRKRMLWVPVSLLSSRQDDTSVLLVLAHLYAVALAIEPLFPDVGADFCADLAIGPLSEISRLVSQMQTTQVYDNRVQTAAMMMEFPRNTANAYHSRRDWARRRSGLQPALQPHQSSCLDSLNLDLGNQIADYGYYQSLSPAFGATPLHVSSHAGSSPGIISPPPAAAARPSYLDVPHPPHSTFDSAQGYLGSNSLYSTPLSAPLASPGTIPPAFAPPSVQEQQQQQAFGFGGLENSWHGGFVAPPTIWT